MKRRTLGLIGVVAHLIAAGVPAAWLFTTKAAAQSPQAQARSVPVFEVEWPTETGLAGWGGRTRSAPGDRQGVGGASPLR